MGLDLREIKFFLWREDYGGQFVQGLFPIPDDTQKVDYHDNHSAFHSRTL